MSKEVSHTSTAGEWYFFSGGPGTPRYGDDPTKHAVDHDTETFVREVLQNANDQGLDDGPVEVRFKFTTLSGDERRDFLESLSWDEGLSDRVEQIAASDRSSGYKRFVDRLSDSEGEIRVLTIEDRNTTGLTGEWDEDSNFAALVRDELYSSKQEDTAGGSYGLGKSVLWTFSSASTVVFNSYPDTGGGQPAETPRLIGRTKLPTHELGGDTYQGAGWLCDPEQTEDGVQPEPLRGVGAEQLAEDLFVDRPHETGTSAMVVGYRDPTRDTRPDLDELGDEFLAAAAKYFWPAITRGDLRVFVETDGETREADVDEVPAIRPFVECFRRRYEEEGTLETPGDVAGLDIPVDLPKRSDGSETPSGDVRLAAQLASPMDDDTYLNHVALFRGAGMVVKYYDQNRVAFGDRNFFGVLACGEARSEHATAEDVAIDRFLRFAEPPDHDDWESTENLRNEYQRGFRTAIDDMFDTVRDGLRHLVAGNARDESSLSNKVLKRFPIHGGIQRRTGASAPSKVFEIQTTSTFRDDRWIFSGTVVPEVDEFERWTAEVSLTGLGEDGTRQQEIPIESITTGAEAATVYVDEDIARIVVNDSGMVEFSGESRHVGSEAVLNGDAGETQLEVRAELEQREE